MILDALPLVLNVIIFSISDLSVQEKRGVQQRTRCYAVTGAEGSLSPMPSLDVVEAGSKDCFTPKAKRGHF